MNLKSSSLNASKLSNNSFSEGDYIAANMLVILKVLNKNSFEIKKMQKSVIKFLYEHGIEADNNHVNTLSETLEHNVNFYFIFFN